MVSGLGREDAVKEGGQIKVLYYPAKGVAFESLQGAMEVGEGIGARLPPANWSIPNLT
ncbi:hypothetical protein KGY71_06995 [Candidatus Bipolaricaulota bacterium]|nr:hypothetical protein [Candidatus Bipolaricaulota bacterium]